MRRHIHEYSASKNKNDEFYTSKEEVELIFEKVINKEFLKDKIIYCPCDGEESEFVIYLKANKEKIGYKEFIYTSDDYNTHIDLFEYADVIITNPPFSKIKKEFFPILKEHAKYWFFFDSVTKMYNYWDKKQYITMGARINFKTPSLNIKTQKYESYVNHIYISNFKCNTINNHIFPTKTYEELYKDKEQVYGVFDNGEKILQIDWIKNIPIDYADKMMVPMTILYSVYIKHFEIIPFSWKNFKYYTDGKK